MRFGLVGTGYWARNTHAPALGDSLTAVWGRDLSRAREVAAPYQASAHSDLDEFFAAVDAVAFSVPPDVQAPIAIRAARAGKHLLLEKPAALTDTDADALADAVEAAGVASVVFFTARFQPEIRDWLAGINARSGWLGGTSLWLGSALTARSPFNSPWRRVMGALWDVGPHAVSLLWAALGPVRSVTADHGLADVTHLVLHHDSGATSAVTLSLSAPATAARWEASVWGEAGWNPLPAQRSTSADALRTALAELTAGAESGLIAHPCDIRFGRDVNHVLSAAAAQLS